VWRRRYKSEDERRVSELGKSVRQMALSVVSATSSRLSTPQRPSRAERVILLARRRHLQQRQQQQQQQSLQPFRNSVVVVVVVATVAMRPLYNARDTRVTTTTAVVSGSNGRPVLPFLHSSWSSTTRRRADRQTDRQTDHALHRPIDKRNNSPHLCTACMRCTLFIMRLMW